MQAHLWMARHLLDSGVLLLLVFTVLKIGDATVLLEPQNGDVRLVGKGSSAHEGRVQIFIDRGDSWKAWGTLCGTSRNKNMGPVLCRQLGYENGVAHVVTYVTSSSFLFPIDDPASVPIWLVNDWRCDSDAHKHVLRCVEEKHINSNEVPTLDEECTHDDDIYVSCDGQMEPENKDVKLCSRELDYLYPSVGLIQVHLKGSWGTVTFGTFGGNHFDKIAADSVCRQLGYTGSSKYGTQWNESLSNCPNADTKWLKGSNCTSVSSCFSCCYDYPPHVCGRHSGCEIEDSVFVQCRYDLSEAMLYKEEYDKCSDVSPGSSVCGRKVVAEGWRTAGIVLTVLIITTILGSILLLWCYFKEPCRKTNNNIQQLQ